MSHLLLHIFLFLAAVGVLAKGGRTSSVIKWTRKSVDE
jgi:hypothetical protein